MASNQNVLQQWLRQNVMGAPRAGTTSVGVAAPRQNNTLASFGGKPVGFFGAPKTVGSNGSATVVAGLGGGAGLPARGPTPGAVLHGGALPSLGGLAPGVTTTGSNRPVYASGAGAMAPGTVAPGAATNAGSGPLSITDIIKQYQEQQDAANAKNEGRYDQLLDNAQADKSETLGAIKQGYGGVAGMAATQAADVRAKLGSGWDAILALAGQDGTKASVERENRREKSELGNAQQSLTNRGLVGTTVSDSVRRGITDDSELRRQGIADAQQDREIGVRQNMLSQTIPTELRLNEGQQGIGLQQTAANVGAIGSANAGRQGIIERRTDEGPDLGLISQLLQQAGSQQVQQAQLAALQGQLAQGQQQSAQTNQYQQLLNSILSQQGGSGGGYPQTLGNGFNGTGRNVANGGAVNYPSAGGFRRPDGSSVFSGVLQAPGYEEHTGAQNVNNGGYNSNPGNYGPGAGLGLGRNPPAAPGTPLPGGSNAGGVNRAGGGYQAAPTGLDPELAQWLWEQMNG